MFGKNPVRKQDLEHPKLWVQEVFATIQGEGPHAGCAAIFVRLAGCNLRCWFCDTDFESSTRHFDARELVEGPIANKQIAVPHSDLIVLTGGEPLRQNIIPLLDRLAARGFYVQIETAGTLWIHGLDYFVQQGIVDIVCSPKTPHVHPMIETWCTHYKYIIAAHEPRASDDGLPLATTQVSRAERKIAVYPKLYRPARSDATIWVQPCEEYVVASREALPVRDPLPCGANLQLCAELVMKHDYRLSLQQHKIIGLP